MQSWSRRGRPTAERAREQLDTLTHARGPQGRVAGKRSNGALHRRLRRRRLCDASRPRAARALPLL